ncbi:cora-like Mg2+ transporter protein-domain-containing protein [Pisolithus microcarpus]|nr:cora-like Mg2+ transporter protein-domain-containing protein [Pisolithus microcarpus]
MADHSVRLALYNVFGGRKFLGGTQADIPNPRRPVPHYRHASPSAPWPWMDFDVDKSAVEPNGQQVSPSSPWADYPRNQFGNWTRDQVLRSNLLTSCSSSQSCSIYKMEVRDDVRCTKFVGEKTTTVTADAASSQAFWEELHQPRPEGVRIRAFFVDSLSLDVLKILGTTFNVEPFFFTSSMNWIPSRYQEDAKAGLGDHITVTLPFICAMRKKPGIGPESISSVGSVDPLRKATHKTPEINTHASLELTHEILLEDLLAIHMVRRKDSSTIISYHPISHLKQTSAKRLQSLVQRTGDSVYWSKLFASSKDPTFVFLAILWYALYAWDESFEVLYEHINKLESRVLGTNDVNLTRELHKLQAYSLHYQQLLHDFHKSVDFVKKTPNPAMHGDEKKDSSAALLEREVDNLLSEISRLEGQRVMLSGRLQNVMHLAFATVNIEDSRAMKRISYLTMVFLPASLMASVFGMNVVEINSGSHETLARYAEATVALTVLTTWLVVAMQTESSFWPKGSPWWHRLAWPIFFTATRMKEWYFRHSRPSQVDQQRSIGFV